MVVEYQTYIHRKDSKELTEREREKHCKVKRKDDNDQLQLLLKESRRQDDRLMQEDISRGFEPRNIHEYNN